MSLKKVRTFNANAPCAKLYNGPCIGGTAVCSRGYPKDSCIKKCMEEDGLDNYAAAKAHFDEWSRKARLLDPKYLEEEKEIDKRVQELKSSFGKPSGAWISFTDGKMEIVSNDGKTISGNKIHYGDTIKTFDDSEVVIVNKNGSDVIMGPNSTLVFLPPRKKRKLIDIKLILGNIWITIKKTNKKFDESFDKMNTDLFILLDRLEAWAKGTKFRCIEKGNVSVIEVYEGTVEVTSKATSEKMILNPRQGVTANKEGMSFFKLSDSDLNMFAKEREAKKTAPPNLSKPSERNSVEPGKTNMPRNRSDEREWQSLGQKSNGAKETQTLPSVRDEGAPKGHTTKYGF